MIRALLVVFTVLSGAVFCLPASRSLHAQEDPRLDFGEPVIYQGPPEPVLSPAETFLRDNAAKVGGNAGGVDVIFPRIFGLRCVQLDYFREEGGTVVCTWTMSGRFDRIFVSVDNLDKGVIPGDSTGVDLGVIPPGEHKIRVEGLSANRTQAAEIIAQVLPSAPIIIEPTQWTASGFTAGGETGMVQISWEVINPLNLVLESYDFCVFFNNDPECVRLTLPACRANTEVGPDGTCRQRTCLSLAPLRPGCFRFEVQAFSNRFASSIGSLCTYGRPLPGPRDAQCRGVSCSGGRINGIELTYSVPDEFEYDAVAVWTVQNGVEDFLGFVDPFADNVGFRGVDLAVEPFEIEIAGARRLDPNEVCPELQFAVGVNDPADIGAVDFASRCPNVLAAEDQVPGEDPNNPAFAKQLVLFTNFPGDGNAGHHVKVLCEPSTADIGCPPPLEAMFRRGDVNINGDVDIADVLALLFSMFLETGSELHCHDAADVNNNGVIAINDPLFLLSALFLGRGTIRPPGPLTCGFDSIADLANAFDDDLPFCRYPQDTCDILVPIGPVDPDVEPVAPGN